jgi:hypothetical protein
MLTRRTRVSALVCLLSLSVFCSRASAQCGQTADRAPRGGTFDGQPAPLALGDSVLDDASGELAGLGFHVNAMVCRTMTQGIAWLQSRSGQLPHLVVLALGTNGYMTQGDIDQVLSILGPNRVLAMVTPHHGDLPYVPGVIRAAARQDRGRIILLDWDRLSAGQYGWFAPDGIHLGGQAGIDAYARLVASTLPFAPQPCPPLLEQSGRRNARRHTRAVARQGLLTQPALAGEAWSTSISITP